MKLCKDCKYYSTYDRLHYCGAFISPVNGDPGAFADIERNGVGFKTSCGATGKLWEPKPQQPPEPPKQTQPQKVSFFRRLLKSFQDNWL